MNKFLLLLFFSFLSASTASAASRDVSYSLQVHALAPNAGGQRAYALRRATNESEWGLFANEYLRAGDYPLMGGLYSFRYPICDQSCVIQFYAQTGVGVSNVGPFIELLWGTNLFWTVRLDVASQILITRDHVVVWSYPLWIGLSVSL